MATKTKKKLLDKPTVKEKSMGLMDRLLAKSKVEPMALRRGQEVEGVVLTWVENFCFWILEQKTEGIVTGDDALDAADLQVS